MVHQRALQRPPGPGALPQGPRHLRRHAEERRRRGREPLQARPQGPQPGHPGQGQAEARGAPRRACRGREEGRGAHPGQGRARHQGEAGQEGDPEEGRPGRQGQGEAGQEALINPTPHPPTIEDETSPSSR